MVNIACPSSASHHVDTGGVCWNQVDCPADIIDSAALTVAVKGATAGSLQTYLLQRILPNAQGREKDSTRAGRAVEISAESIYSDLIATLCGPARVHL